MDNKIKQVIRKTYGYWWVDGMLDIAMGLLFGGLAGYNYVMTSVPLKEPWNMVLAIAEPIFFVIFWLLYGRLVKWVKEHITYRRTGYVAYQVKKKKDRALRAVVGGVLGFLMAITVTYIGPEILKIDSALVVGFLLALVSLFLAYSYGIGRLFLVALAEFGVGWYVSTLSLAEEPKSTLLMALIGAIWLVSGSSAFILYILRTKPIEEEDG